MAETHYPDHVQTVLELVAAADVPALTERLRTIAVINGDSWSWDGLRVTQAIDRMPEVDRIALLTELRRDTPSARPKALVRIISWRLSHELTPTSATALLDAAMTDGYEDDDDLARYASVLLDAGQTIPADVTAFLRRTALACDAYDPDPHSPLKRILGRLSAPLLNPGEAWADQVLADLPAMGTTWPALLAHARTATGARPPDHWQQQTRQLLSPLDPDVASQSLCTWFTLVDHAPPKPGDEFDPYNLTVLRGLVLYAALLPQRPDTARVLGVLVDATVRPIRAEEHNVVYHGAPRAPQVANAAVFALARLASPQAHTELARLRAAVTIAGVSRHLNEVIAAVPEF